MISIQPHLSTAALTTSCGASGLSAFASITIASMPFGVWISVAVCSAWVRELWYVRRMLAPRFASSMAIPLPIPREPPVMMAFFRFRDILVVASGCGR